MACIGDRYACQRMVSVSAKRLVCIIVIIDEEKKMFEWLAASSHGQYASAFLGHRALETTDLATQASQI